MNDFAAWPAGCSSTIPASSALDTGDVMQNAFLRLFKALEATKPESVLHFYNLALMQIRRELIDLGRRYRGPKSQVAKHYAAGAGTTDDPREVIVVYCDRRESDSLELWTNFHLHVLSIPEKEREVVNLLWYQGLIQEDAAKVLGVSPRTVKRRWLSARLRLEEKLRDDLPP